MRRTKAISKTTTNRRIYRITAIYSQLYCPICGLNRGCNRERRWDHKWADGWKDKNVKKQWQRHL